jgi:outer membrane immunogenic protein
MKTDVRINSLLLLAASFTGTAVAHAQVPDQPGRYEFATTYSYVHSNVPPGGCGCFNLNGVSFEIARSIGPGGFALAGDVGVVHAGSVGSPGDSLTLSSYTGGVRYAPRLRTPLHPFGKVLVGLAHAGGSLASAPNPAASDAGAAFAALVGGGFDVRTGAHVVIRLIEADYLATTFDNGSNDHQNNLRISAGLAFRF